ncbi:uncharacterized protein LOC110832430 isoform X3 [Zootermopsis nevadensis]|uniref:uncharacterized protein LOC110832430 isoform X3 n=1 Tax=Zootermopsis nevadensis TaxID=136037 RepID=UPI000B8EA8BD|nr:uncharacterized protein LOC110832430 isoform X3 [Zootermopsis nevadensis]
MEIQYALSVQRMVVPPHQQMEYSSSIPNYSAPSSVCTSDSGGGGSGHGRMRTIRLHRRLTGNHPGPPNFGFSVRGGREHGTGFFVSAVEQGSEAHCQGLKIGDQIVKINGYSVVDAVHREVLLYIKSQNHLELRVRTVGMIPVKDKRTDPLTWRVVEEDRVRSSPELSRTIYNGNSEDIIRDVRLFLNVAPRMKLECGICKGPEWKPGIFVQFTKENGLAREAGLQPGDQILQCNGVPFIDIPFSEAVNVLKTSRQLDLIIRKGSGSDLFPGESSGYNSSSSSVNGDQSPSWGDTKRLSIVKEESVELEDRLGQLDCNHHIKDWDQIEYGWEKTEPKQKKNSPVLRVHFEENGNSRIVDETNRDMSELSLVSSGRNSVAGADRQHSEQKFADGAKLAEIRMVSQQSETKTVVVEVHRSQEVDDSVAIPKTTLVSERLTADEGSKDQNSLAKSPSSSSFISIGSSTASSSLSSAISQELQRRSKRHENEGYRETERKKDFLKAIDGEKRQQHEQLMDEFRRVHRKMFAHSIAAENQGSTSCQSEATQFKISHSLEERELHQRKQTQKDDKGEKVSLQRTLVTTKDHNLQDQQGKSDVREVTIISNSRDVPPPPPPMPSHESESLSSSWKPSSPALSLASSGKILLNERPPSCPTPDYDTSSSLSISSAESLITSSKNSASQAKLPSPSFTYVNTNNKPMLNPQSRLTITNSTKSTVTASQTTSKNADTVEMQSIESFTLTNPHSPKPKPPEIYFVPVRNKKKPQHSSDTNQSTWKDDRLAGKQRPVSITISEYPSGVERRVPTRFDFLPTYATEVRKSTSQVDGSSITSQLHSELAQTLSRSNLQKRTDSQDSLQNGISTETASAKGTITISVNSHHSGKNITNSRPSHGYSSRPQVTNGANKIHIENNTKSMSKSSVVSVDNKTQIPASINAADKEAKSLVTNNRVTITVPNGTQSSK